MLAVARHGMAWVALTMARAAAAGACASLAGCGVLAWVPAGPVARGERTILVDSLAIMLAIVIPTAIATLGVAFWFRSSNGRAVRLPNWSYSGRVEVVTWSIPALVVLFLGGVAWIGSHDLDPARALAGTAAKLRIQVISLDWKWLFIYPDEGVASINQLVVPANTELELDITSASVFNVFFVPQLGSEIYAMSGMQSRLNLQADGPGTYPGLSAHFSGDGFSGMQFNVQAVPQQEFVDWVARARSAGPTLDAAGYRALLPQSENLRPFTYRSVQQGIFESILRQEMPAGEGPRPAAPDTTLPPGHKS